MENPKKHTKKYKIIFLGNLGVGKTCLLYRYVDDVYDAQKPYISTVIVDFKTRDLVIGDDSVQL